MAAPSVPRLRGLDALRGVAVSAVLLHHYTANYARVTERPLDTTLFLPDGHYGVELFFVISGFVIFMTLEHCRDALEFAVSRFARLVPAFLACLAISSLALWWIPIEGMQPLSAARLLANLTMMPKLFLEQPIDGVYWTLVHEIGFYCLAGAGFFLAGPKRVEPLCFAWLCVAFFCRTGAVDVPFQLWILAGVQYAPQFTLGILVYLWHAGRARPSTLILLGFALAICITGPVWSLRPISGPLYILVVAGATALVALGSRDGSFLGRIAPLVFLGDISYPLYLLHQNLGYIVIHHFTAWGSGADLAMLGATAFAVALAYAISRWVEKPARAWLRASLARPPVHAPASAAPPAQA
ncbi:MAG TPA: acyltransferase [Stellaceae bacterium]|nr:acyltransferase [Stellaceae bacterium]